MNKAVRKVNSRSVVHLYILVKSPQVFYNYPHFFTIHIFKMLKSSIYKASTPLALLRSAPNLLTKASPRFFAAFRDYHLPSNHPILSKLATHPSSKIAIRHVPTGNTYTYNDMIHDIGFWRQQLKDLTKVSDAIDSSKPMAPGSGARIAIMGENSYQFAVMFYAALTLPNTLAVPLCTNHTSAEIEYQLDDSQAEIVVTPERFLSKLSLFNGQPIDGQAGSSRKVLTFESIQPVDKMGAKNLSSEPIEFTDEVTSAGSGYMLYTSGTSGKPKGVVTPLETFTAQAHALSTAWKISQETNFLHTLPLHHVHGVLIALTLSVLAGGRVEFAFPFKPETVLNRIAGIDAFETDPETGEKVASPPINTYTAVPTIYTRLAEYLKDPANAEFAASAELEQGFNNLKLAMCGSAALPDPLRNAWDSVTNGDVPLLERYGMTETGITLTQPLNSSKRVAGTVGKPAPTIIARIVDLQANNGLGHLLYESGTGGFNSPPKVKPETVVEGDLLMGGPTVFNKYWRKDAATAESFLSEQQLVSIDGSKSGRWFITGDVARYDPETDTISILGRASMDIIKSGGEKLSALEIEREILSLPEVAEAAVVGVPDKEWGEAVTVILVLKPSLTQSQKDKFTLDHLKSQLKKRLAGWKIPKKMLVIDAIPRNQMGKVNKKALVKTFFP